VRPSGGIALRPSGAAKPAGTRGLAKAVQDETLPFNKSLFRTGSGSSASLARLDALWRETRAHLHADGLGAVQARETAAMLATARWTHAATLARPESRGMHRRTDVPETIPTQARRLRIGGLDEIWTAPEIAAREEVFA
jgi:succinate dehydrogenase/fumarate reductase flavoprotein subunit